MKIGDVVIFKYNNSIKMTVNGINQDKTVNCIWFEENKLVMEDLMLEAISIYNPGRELLDVEHKSQAS